MVIIMDSSLNTFLNEIKILSDKLYLFELQFLKSLDVKISHSELRVICYIGSVKRCILSDICKSTGIKKNNLTAIYKDLFSKGFISRAKTDDDKRVMYVSLSRSGNSIYNEYLESRNSFFKKVLNNSDLTIVKSLKSL